MNGAAGMLFNRSNSQWASSRPAPVQPLCCELESSFVGMEVLHWRSVPRCSKSLWKRLKFFSFLRFCTILDSSPDGANSFTEAQKFLSRRPPCSLECFSLLCLGMRNSTGLVLLEVLRNASKKDVRLRNITIFDYEILFRFQKCRNEALIGVGVCAAAFPMGCHPLVGRRLCIIEGGKGCWIKRVDWPIPQVTVTLVTVLNSAELYDNYRLRHGSDVQHG